MTSQSEIHSARGGGFSLLTTVSIMYGISILVLGALVISAPLTVLLDRFIPDDAFYYYNTARIFAQTGYSSFDGIHFTNGQDMVDAIGLR